MLRSLAIYFLFKHPACVVLIKVSNLIKIKYFLLYLETGDDQLNNKLNNTSLQID